MRSDCHNLFARAGEAEGGAGEKEEHKKHHAVKDTTKQGEPSKKEPVEGKKQPPASFEIVEDSSSTSRTIWYRRTDVKPVTSTMIESFEDNRNQWPVGTLGKANTVTATVSQGRYLLKTKKTSGRHMSLQVSTPFSVSTAQDFAIRLKGEYLEGKPSVGFSLQPSDSLATFLRMYSCDSGVGEYEYQNLFWFGAEATLSPDNRFTVEIRKQDKKLTALRNGVAFYSVPIPPVDALCNIVLSCFLDEGDPLVAVDELLISNSVISDSVSIAVGPAGDFYEEFDDNRNDWKLEWRGNYRYDFLDGYCGIVRTLPVRFSNTDTEGAFLQSRNLVIDPSRNFTMKLHIETVGRFRYSIVLERTFNLSLQFVSVVGSTRLERMTEYGGDGMNGGGFFERADYDGAYRIDCYYQGEKYFSDRRRSRSVDVESPNDMDNSPSENTIEIRKRGNSWIFLVNGDKLAEAPFRGVFGNRIFFVGKTFNKILIDYVHITYEE